MKSKSLHPPVPGRKLNVCAYARISNDKDLAQSSLEEQIDFYTSLIIENPGWSFAGIYADKGISGTTAEARPQFMEMIEKAKLGYIDIILVKSVSRFARNVIDLLNAIRALKQAGVEVIFEEQNNLSTFDEKCDVILTLHSKFAEEEPKSMSANVQWYYEKRFNNGDYDLPPNLYGYGRDENKKPMIIESEAKWIRKMFEIYEATTSTTEVLNYLLDNKVKTRNGTQWSNSKIRCILRNEKYCGNALLQKGIVEDVLQHKRVRNTGQTRQVLVTGGHPAIVTQDQWEHVQKIMDQNRIRFGIATYEPGERKANEFTTFTSYAYCPHCGSNYRIKTNHYDGKATHKFFVCASNSSSKRCKSDNLAVSTMESAILKALEFIRINSSSLKRELEGIYVDEDTSALNESLERVESKINDLRAKYSKFKDQTGEFYDEIKKEINAEIRELAKEKLLIQNEMAIASSSGFRIKKIMDAVKRIPAELTSIDDFDFRQVFPRAIIKSKDYVFLVMGNQNIEGIKKNQLIPTFETSVDYKVRKTMFKCKIGILINK